MKPAAPKSAENFCSYLPHIDFWPNIAAEKTNKNKTSAYIELKFKKYVSKPIRPSVFILIRVQRN